MDNDRGQAVMLLLAVIVIAALAVVGVGDLSVRVVNRGRAQTAADAAALAGTTGGRSGASRLAAENGAVLVGYSEADQVVAVVVDVNGEQAAAKATDGP